LALLYSVVRESTTVNGQEDEQTKVLVRFMDQANPASGAWLPRITRVLQHRQPVSGRCRVVPESPLVPLRRLDVGHHAIRRALRRPYELPLSILFGDLKGGISLLAHGFLVGSPLRVQHPAHPRQGLNAWMACE